MPLGKTLNAYFLLGPTGLCIVVVQRDERLANQTQKKWLARLDRRRVLVYSEQTIEAKVSFNAGQT